MFEKLAASVLNKYLGRFFKDVDEQSIEVGIWSGVVTLKDLELKSEAFDWLHLPLTVRHGTARELTLEADWSKLGSKPVKITIADVFVLAGPVTQFDLNEQEERAYAIANQLARLQELETLHVLEVEEVEEESTMTSRLIEKIVDNIQLYVKNVHIRYESEIGVQRRPFACGIALDALSVFTSDEKGNPTFAVAQATLHKRVTLQGFCVYLNPHDDPVPASELGPVHNHVERMEQRSQPFFYLLAPMDAVLMYCKNRSVDRQPAQSPRVRLELVLADVSFFVRESQWGVLLFLVTDLQRAQIRMTDQVVSHVEHIFRPGRPEELDEYLGLYKRTLNCYWQTRLCTEEEFRMEQLETTVRYEDLGQTRLLAIAQLRRELGGKQVTKRSADTTKKENKASESPGPEEKAKSEKKTASYLSSWVSYLTGADSASSSSQEAPEGPKVVLSDEEKLLLSQEVNLQSFADYSREHRNVPDDYVLVEVAVELEHVNVCFQTASCKTLLACAGKGVSFRSQQFPKSRSVRLAMRDLSVRDNIVKNSVFPTLLSRLDIKSSSSSSSQNQSTKSSSSSSYDPVDMYSFSPEHASDRGGREDDDSENSNPTPQLPLLQLQFNSSRGVAEFHISGVLEALQLVLNYEVVRRMRAFFKTKYFAQLWQGQRYVEQHEEVLCTPPSPSLEEALLSYFVKHVRLDVRAPVLLVPQDPADPRATVLVFDLGKLAVQSVGSVTVQSVVPVARKDLFSELETKVHSPAPSPSPLPPSESVQQTLKESHYDEYECHATAIRVFLTTCDAAERAVRPKQRDDDFLTELVPAVDCKLKVGFHVAPGDSGLPATKISGAVPELSVRLTSNAYARLVLLLDFVWGKVFVSQQTQEQKSRHDKQRRLEEGKQLEQDAEARPLRRRLVDILFNEFVHNMDVVTQKDLVGVYGDSQRAAFVLASAYGSPVTSISKDTLRTFWRSRNTQVQKYCHSLVDVKVQRVSVEIVDDVSDAAKERSVAFVTMRQVAVHTESRGGHSETHASAGQLDVLGRGASDGSSILSIAAPGGGLASSKDRLRIVASYTAPWHQGYVGVGNALEGFFARCEVKWDQAGVLAILRAVPPPSSILKQQVLAPEASEGSVDDDTKEWFALRKQELEDACVRLWWVGQRNSRKRVEGMGPGLCGSCEAEEDTHDAHLRCQRCDGTWCGECVWEICDFFMLDDEGSHGLVCRVCVEASVEELHDDQKQTWKVGLANLVLSDEVSGLCDVRGEDISFSSMKTKGFKETSASVGSLRVLDLMQGTDAACLSTLFESKAPVMYSSSYFTRAAQDERLVGAQVTSEVTTGGAVVNWNPQSVVSIYECLERAVNAVLAAYGYTDEYYKQQQQQQEEEDGESKAPASQRTEWTSNEHKADEFDLKLTVVLDGLEMYMNKDHVGERCYRLDTEHLRMTLWMCGPTMAADVALRPFALENIKPRCVEFPLREIVAIRDRDAAQPQTVDIRFETFDKKLADWPGCRSLFRMRANDTTTKLVYDQSLFMEFVDYFFIGVLGALMADDGEPLEGHLRLDLQFDNLSVMMPCCEREVDGLQAECPRLTVVSSPVTRDGVDMDEMAVSGELELIDSASGEVLMQSSRLLLTIAKPVDAVKWERERVDPLATWMWIKGGFQSSVLDLDEERYHTLMRVLFENLTAWPHDLDCKVAPSRLQHKSFDPNVRRDGLSVVDYEHEHQELPGSCKRIAVDLHDFSAMLKSEHAELLRLRAKTLKIKFVMTPAEMNSTYSFVDFVADDMLEHVASMKRLAWVQDLSRQDARPALVVQYVSSTVPVVSESSSVENKEENKGLQQPAAEDSGNKKKGEETRTEAVLTISAPELNVNWNPYCIRSVVRWFNHSAGGDVESKGVAEEDPLLATEASKWTSNEQRSKTIFYSKTVTEIGVLRLSMNKDRWDGQRRSLCTLHAENANVEYYSFFHTMLFEFTCDNMALQNNNPTATASEHAMLLQLTGGGDTSRKAVVISFESFDPKLDAYPGHYSDLCVHFNRDVELVYLQQNWQEIIDYYWGGIWECIFSEEATRKAAEELRVTPPDQLLRELGLLDITLGKAVIVLPQKEESVAALIAQADSFALSNSGLLYKKHAMDELLIDARQFSIRHGDSKGAPLLLEPVNMAINFRRPLNYEAWVAAFPISPCRWITGEMDRATFNVTRDIYALLMLVSWENFAPPYPEKKKGVDYSMKPLRHDSVGPPILYYFDAWDYDPTLIFTEIHLPRNKIVFVEEVSEGRCAPLCSLESKLLCIGWERHPSNFSMTTSATMAGVEMWDRREGSELLPFRRIVGANLKKAAVARWDMLKQLEGLKGRSAKLENLGMWTSGKAHDYLRSHKMPFFHAENDLKELVRMVSLLEDPASALKSPSGLPVLHMRYLMGMTKQKLTLEVSDLRCAVVIPLFRKLGPIFAAIPPYDVPTFDPFTFKVAFKAENLVLLLGENAPMERAGDEAEVLSCRLDAVADYNEVEDFKTVSRCAAKAAITNVGLATSFYSKGELEVGLKLVDSLSAQLDYQFMVGHKDGAAMAVPLQSLSNDQKVRKSVIAVGLSAVDMKMSRDTISLITSASASLGGDEDTAAAEAAAREAQKEAERLKRQEEEESKKKRAEEAKKAALPSSSRRRSRMLVAPRKKVGFAMSDSDSDEELMEEMAAFESSFHEDRSEFNVKLARSGLSITLLSDRDYGNFPLLNLSMEPADHKADWLRYCTLGHGGMNLNLITLVAVEFFNPSTSKWEAVVHWTRFFVKGTKEARVAPVSTRLSTSHDLELTDVEEEAESHSVYKVRAMNPVDVRISSTLVGMMTYIASVDNEKEATRKEEHKEVTRKVFAPYKIRNDTGLACSYWMRGEQVRTTLDPGEEGALKKLEVGKGGHDHDCQPRADVTMNIDVAGVGVLHDVPVAKKGEHGYMLNGVPLVVHVVLEKNGRNVVVRGLRAFYNATDVPMELLIVGNKERGMQSVTIVVGPHRTAFVPVMVQDWSKLCMRPHGGDYHYSQSFHDTWAIQQLRCEYSGSDGAGHSWFVQVGLDHHSFESVALTYRIEPPLHIINQFAYPVRIRITRDTSHSAIITADDDFAHAERTVKSGAACSWHDVDWDWAGGSYQFSFMIESGYDWSERIDILNEEVRPEYRQVAVTDLLSKASFAQGRSEAVDAKSSSPVTAIDGEQVLVTTVMSSRYVGGRILTLFCDYWVVNQCERELWYLMYPDREAVKQLRKKKNRDRAPPIFSVASSCRPVQMHGFPRESKEAKFNLTVSLDAIPYTLIQNATMGTKKQSRRAIELINTMAATFGAMKHGGDPSDGVVTLVGRSAEDVLQDVTNDDDNDDTLPEQKTPDSRAESKNKSYLDLAVQFDPCLPAFPNTHTLSFSSRYIIENECGFALRLHHAGGDCVLAKDMCSEFSWPFSVGNDKDAETTLLRLSPVPDVEAKDSSWTKSASFRIDEIGQFTLASRKVLKRRRAILSLSSTQDRSLDAESYLFDVQILLHRASFLVRIFAKRGSDENYPYRFVNKSSYTLKCQQLLRGEDSSDDEDDTDGARVASKKKRGSGKNSGSSRRSRGSKRGSNLKNQHQMRTFSEYEEDILTQLKVDLGHARSVRSLFSNRLETVLVKPGQSASFLPGDVRCKPYVALCQMHRQETETSRMTFSRVKLTMPSLDETREDGGSISDDVALPSGEVFIPLDDLGHNAQHKLADGYFVTVNIAPDGEQKVVTVMDGVVDESKKPMSQIQFTLPTVHIALVTVAPVSQSLGEIRARSNKKAKTKSKKEQEADRKRAEKAQERESSFDQSIMTADAAEFKGLDDTDDGTVTQVAAMLHLFDVQYSSEWNSRKAITRVQVDGLQLDNPDEDTLMGVVVSTAEKFGVKKVQKPKSKFMSRFRKKKADEPVLPGLVSVEMIKVSAPDDRKGESKSHSSMDFFNRLKIVWSDSLQLQIEEKFIIRMLKFASNCSVASFLSSSAMAGETEDPFLQGEGMQLSTMAFLMVKLKQRNSVLSYYNIVDKAFAFDEKHSRARLSEIVGKVSGEGGDSAMLDEGRLVSNLVEAEHLALAIQAVRRDHDAIRTVCSVYFREAEFSDFKFDLTFKPYASKHSLIRQTLKSSNLPVGKSVLGFISTAVLNINRAEIVLSRFDLRQRLFSDYDSVREGVVQHYLASLIRQIPAIVGSTTVLGSPLRSAKGLIRGAKSGMGGLTQEVLAETGHLVGSVTGSAGSGLSLLTGKRFKSNREKRLRDKPQNTLSGLGKAAYSVGSGLATGIADIVRSPVRGAKKHGVRGFLTGLGEGLLGVAVKPTVGVLDGLSQVTHGIGYGISAGPPPRNVKRVAEEGVRAKNCFLDSRQVLDVDRQPEPKKEKKSFWKRKKKKSND